LSGAFIVVLTGFLDDKYNLNPYLRLVLGLIAAAFPIASGIGISFITNPLGGTIDLSYPRWEFFLYGHTRSVWILSDLFGLLWILFMMNMLNMGAKGIDGQLPGVVVIAGLVVALLSLKFSADITQWPVIVLSLIVAGSYLGFLPWNYFPQKIMPSYSGSTLAGYMLAVISILATAKVGVLVVSLGIPAVDTVYSVVRRILNKKSPVWGDRGHLHHLLLDKGLSKKQVVYLYWAGTAFLALLAFNLNTQSKLYTILTTGVLISLLIFWLKKNEHQD
jgi:UDP-GlcNAc:undecaprenyl-phosphate GlcNAc-1-phosphate transferase